jgi:preprotein translocase subunit YajC
MVSVLMSLFFFVLMMFASIREGKRRAAVRARRIEAYRASPESHIVRLH